MLNALFDDMRWQAEPTVLDMSKFQPQDRPELMGIINWSANMCGFSVDLTPTWLPQVWYFLWD